MRDCRQNRLLGASKCETLVKHEFACELPLACCRLGCLIPDFTPGQEKNTPGKKKNTQAAPAQFRDGVANTQSTTAMSLSFKRAWRIQFDCENTMILYSAPTASKCETVVKNDARTSKNAKRFTFSVARLAWRRFANCGARKLRPFCLFDQFGTLSEDSFTF